MSSPVNDTFALIAETLIEEGFQMVPGIEPSFKGVIREGGIDFELGISRIDPNFEKLPEVYLIKHPEELPALLPHVERSNKLCYFDRQGNFLDPFYPSRTMRVLIDAVRSTLRIITDPTQTQQELAGEFWAYWEADISCFLTTDQRNAVTGFYRRSDLNGANQRELVISADLDGLQNWCIRRNASLEEDQLGQAIIIKMTEAPKLQAEGHWPPQTWGAFLDWLRCCHSKTEQQLLRALLEVTKKRSNITIVLHSDRGGPFGIRVEFLPQVQEMLTRFRTKTRKGSNSPIQARRMDSYRRLISNKQMVKQFFRLFVSDASARFVYERNLRAPSLINRKIALLGCGTIGSHAAQLLQKAGAGTGPRGLMDLFDGDSLYAGNLGRHLLGVEYLLESKGRSVADFLNKTSPSQTLIRGGDHFKVDNLKLIRDYDLIIDATGEETFSCLLASEAQLLRRQKKHVPPLLHAWVDASGYAVRALLDDGVGACYRCLKVQEQGMEPGAVKERFELFACKEDEKSASVVSHRCGESFIPFAAGISSALAGMVQQMTLEVFTDDLGPRFRHQSYAQFIRRTRDHNPKRSKDCPCCSPPQT